MLMTLCKKTAALRASRAGPVGTAFLCLCAAFMFSVTPAAAAETVHLPSSPPPTLPDGGANLNEAWVRHGGARLYWNTLMQPRQLRMAGASFADPAAVPDLMPSPQGQTGGKSVGKSRAGAKTAPHSVVIDPGAPLMPMRGASRSAARTGGTARKADTTIPRVTGQKPASVSPALTAPSASGSGKAATDARVGSAAADRPGNGVAPGTPALAPDATPRPQATQNSSAAQRSAAVTGSRAGNGTVLPGVEKADKTPAGAGISGHAAPGATVPEKVAVPATPPSSLPGVLSGSGAAAGALSQGGSGVARDTAGAAPQGVLPPPPVPSLSADDLLPPSNGSSGAAPVRAPLP